MLSDFADVGMKEGVVADLVAFALNALHEADVLLGLGADHHEGSLDVFLLEDVENFRRPLGIGPVVKGDGNLVGMVAVVFDRVRVRKYIHVLVDDEFFARIGLIGIHGHGAFAGLRQAGDAKNVAIALFIDVVSGLQ